MRIYHDLHSLVGGNDRNEQKQNSPGRPKAHSNDLELLDAYSQAVVNVVDGASPALISVSSPHSRGSGSGFLISPDGLAITNSHVVAGRTQLVAQTADGDRIDAELIGEDPSNDVALLRLASSDLPFADLGDSDQLRVGQLVVAMGSPLGLHSTVSTGVVSALGRSMRGQDGRLIENVVQHAAPINPGNSGGPLADTRGRVVGINTAIIAYTQGLGFAIPSNTVKWVITEVLAYGKVRRRQLGIAATVVKLSSQAIVDLDLLSDHAVEVVEVDPDGIAARNGLRIGDLITSVNDRIVSNVDDIHRILTVLPSQVELDLAVIRAGKLISVKITAAS